ncbi:MAG: DUF4956 domain-containing protein [Cytophagales bacterium]|nr:DUF4956 domain-containing protein [Cytophagales bacterium]
MKYQVALLLGLLAWFQPLNGFPANTPHSSEKLALQENQSSSPFAVKSTERKETSDGFIFKEFYNFDVLKMLVLFLMNLISISVIIRLLYYKTTRNTEYLFTYYMVSIVLFFLCFTLGKFTLDVGMALGLFAIFGIIRYRTQTIEIREMTYLFVVIGVSVINALVNDQMSFLEILLVNISIIVSIMVIEKTVLSKGRSSERNIVYDELENVKPENYEKLLLDLREKTGLQISRVSVQKVDLTNNVATLTLYYTAKI